MAGAVPHHRSVAQKLELIDDDCRSRFVCFSSFSQILVRNLPVMPGNAFRCVLALSSAALFQATQSMKLASGILAVAVNR